MLAARDAGEAHHRGGGGFELRTRGSLAGVPKGPFVNRIADGLRLVRQFLLADSEQGALRRVPVGRRGISPPVGARRRGADGLSICVRGGAVGGVGPGAVAARSS